jgi:Ca2+-binding RTX toxin-like protein
MWAPGAAVADTPTCQGKSATIVGPNSGHSTEGTPGDDVVVTTAEGAAGPGFIKTGDGDDVVCIVPGAGVIPHPEVDSGFDVTTGAGNDTVVVEETRKTSYLSVVLGAGDDTFVGSPRNERVYAGEIEGTYPSLGVDDGRDTITGGLGEDHIYSGSPNPETPNHDVVSSGEGGDTLYVGGTGAVVDNGAGMGDGLFLARLGRQQRVSVNNVAGQATADAGVFLRWSNVNRFSLFVDSPLSFNGSAGPDSIGLSTSVPVGERHTIPVDVHTNGGDDRLKFFTGAMNGTVDGGDGVDALEVPKCMAVKYRLGETFDCTTANHLGQPVQHRVRVTGWEGRAGVFAHSSAIVVGTERDDEIVVRAPAMRVSSLGGDDEVTVSVLASRRARAVLKGGDGSDKLIGALSSDVLFGGRGRDLLIGSRGDDRIVGGPGNDTARGGRGKDRCFTEQRLRCELPRT